MRVLEVLLIVVGLLFAKSEVYPTNNVLNDSCKINFAPIGYFITPYGDGNAPRQGVVEPTVKAKIIIDTVYRKALKDLDEYEYIHVLYFFDKIESWTPYGHPPKGSTQMGMFATRSPRRPNPIGLGVVKLDSVDIRRGILYIEGTDAYNNTPVLDIKPYIPWVDIKETELSDSVKKKLGIDKFGKETK